MPPTARTYAAYSTPQPPGKGEGVASVNGNITELERYAGVDKIDDLEYYYDHEDHATKTGLGSNRLYLVDEQSTHTDGNDLKSGIKTAAGFDRNDPTSWNYHYDPIGNLIKDVNEGIDLITWTVTGKVSEVVFDPAKQNYNLAFRYDPMGNRIAKIQKPHNSLANCTTWTITWYARDAQGNTLAVYNKPTDSLTFRATEFNIYGSSRLGMVTQPEPLPETPTVPLAHSQTLGLKVYEFSNHLGNVLTTFSDRKIATEGTPGYVAYYTAEILSSTDYYPFGFQMPGRVYEGDGYRYGYQGSEKDDEIKGSGNSYTTFYRLLDPRIGRWFSLDPKVTPSDSPYGLMRNSPIVYNDELGDTIKFAPDSRLFFKIRIITSLVILYMIDNGCRKQIRDIRKAEHIHTFMEGDISVVKPLTMVQWHDARSRIVNDFNLSTRVSISTFEDPWTGTITPENLQAYESALSEQQSAVDQLWDDITATQPSVWPHENQRKGEQIGDGTTIEINLKETHSLVALISHELRHAWDCNEGRAKIRGLNNDPIVSERSRYRNKPEMAAINQANRIIGKLNKIRIFRPKLELRNRH